MYGFAKANYLITHVAKSSMGCKFAQFAVRKLTRRQTIAACCCVIRCIFECVVFQLVLYRSLSSVIMEKIIRIYGKNVANTYATDSFVRDGNFPETLFRLISVMH